MWFSLFGTVLILAITFYEGLQGLFTGLINCILTVISVALAFGLYEDIYYAFLASNQPYHGRAIALMAVFIVALLILRTLFDMFIKNNLQFPVYVDRAGGGLFGFITGMLVVGMLSLGFEMLPFGDSVLGFSRFALVEKDTKKAVTPEEASEMDPSKLTYTRNATWLKHEAFTVALASHLSGNALAGRHRLSESYPDFLASAHRARARMGEDVWLTPEKDLTIDVDSYWPIRQSEFYARQRKEGGDKTVQIVPSKLQPAGGGKRLAFRLKINTKIEFAREQFRLVVHDEKTGRTTEHLPVGINDDKAGNKLVEFYDGELVVREFTGKNNLMDLVFEVPESAEFGEGSFLEYKQNLRIPITARQAKSDKDKPTAIKAAPSGSDTTSDAGTDASTSGNSAADIVNRSKGSAGDRVSGIGPASGSLVSDELPIKLQNYSTNGEVVSGEYRGGGNLWATLDENWSPLPGDKTVVERFQVPDDMRLMQISVQKLHPGSLAGQVLDFTRTNLNDYKLVDQNGKEWMLVGMYAFARVNGKPMFEASFLDETARQGQAVFGRATPLQHIKSSHMKGQYAFYYLFQVPVGTKAVKVRTGRNDVSLEKENLVAQ